jgi:hypothetical protein
MATLMELEDTAIPMKTAGMDTVTIITDMDMDTRRTPLAI